MLSNHRNGRIQILVGLIAFTLVAAGCVGGNASPSADTETAAPPPLTATEKAELSTLALTRLCGQLCNTYDVYVHDSIFTATTLAGNEKPMPPETKDAIQGAFPDATFVTNEGANALFSADALVEGGNGVLLSIGPVRFLRDDVIGIEVGMVTARDGGHGQVEQFRWTGEAWEPADSTVTGVTTTSWVS